MGLPAAHAAAEYLPDFEMDFFEDSLNTVTFQVRIKCPCKQFRVESNLHTGLVGLACDDSLVSRKMMKMLMTTLDLSDQSFTLGER